MNAEGKVLLARPPVEGNRARSRRSSSRVARATSSHCFDWDSKAERMLQIFHQTVREWKGQRVSSDEEIEEIGLDLQG